MKYQTGDWVIYGDKKVRFENGMIQSLCKPIFIKHHILRANGFTTINRCRNFAIKKFDFGDGYVLHALVKPHTSLLMKNGVCVKHVRYIHQLQHLFPDAPINLFMEEPIDFYGLSCMNNMPSVITRKNIASVVMAGFNEIDNVLSRSSFGQQYKEKDYLHYKYMKNHLCCEWEDHCKEMLKKDTSLAKKNAQGIAHAN